MAVMDVIRCEELSKRYGKIRAVDGLNLTVDEGTAFGLIGPNGAGKTTTLRLFTGLTNADAGRVWVAGEEVSKGTLQWRSKVGYLPESPAFYGWMTGRQYLQFTGELYGLNSGETKVRAEQLLEQVSLTEAADRKTKGYSRGMQQRLGLAQALLNRPAVLLLDEPASALDPIGRRDMLETLLALKGQTTVFISTHILADVERVCDRVAIVNHGKLVTSGSVDQLRAQRQQSIFELEFEDDAAALAGQLAEMPWVKSTDRLERGNRQVFQVQVIDVGEANRKLLRLVYESGLNLLRYELIQASLEDVFMELLGEENK